MAPTNYRLSVKKKGKGFPVHTMKAHIGSRGMAPLIFNLSAR